MKKIHTVTGEILPEELGFCHSHEHLLLSRGESFRKSPVLLLDDFDRSLAEVNAYAAAGGRAVVEAQPVGCNRVADDLERLSLKSGVRIIASTGFHKMLFYPENHWIFRYSETQMEDVFLRGLTKGMFVNCDESEPEEQITAKAGQVKCALDTVGLDVQYRKLFCAAVRACKATGAPMMVHIERGSDPLELADFLAEKGLPGKNGSVIFCHMDRACDDIEIHKRIAKSGVFLEYDTIGRFKYHSDEEEIAIIKELMGAGYEDRLLLSLDSTRARLKSYTPEGIGLTYIIDRFIPMMKKAGITQKQIKKMMIYNPAEAFAY